MEKAELEMCPVCNQVQILISSGTDVQKMFSACAVPQTSRVLETNAKPGECIVPSKDEPSELDLLRAENARFREALEFYADKAWINIKMPYCTEVDFDDVSKPFPDQKPMGGRRAREALNYLRKGGQ